MMVLHFGLDRDLNYEGYGVAKPLKLERGFDIAPFTDQSGNFFNSELRSPLR